MPDGIVYTDAVGVSGGRDPLGGHRIERETWVRSLLYMVDDGLPGPALELRLPGNFRLLWPVEPGSRTFTVWCRHSGHTPRPRVRVAAAPGLGVSADVTAEAQDTTEWHRLAVSVNVTSVGVLEVFLEHRSTAVASWSRWDNASAG